MKNFVFFLYKCFWRIGLSYRGVLLLYNFKNVSMSKIIEGLSVPSFKVLKIRYVRGDFIVCWKKIEHRILFNHRYDDDCDNTKLQKP